MECSWAELFEESASGMLYRKDRFLFMSVLVKEVAVILGDEPVLPPGCLFELFYVFGMRSSAVSSFLLSTLQL